MASLYGAVILIVASVLSYALGQDNFSWWHILAMAMIVAAVYLVEIAERQPDPPVNPQKQAADRHA